MHAQLCPQGVVWWWVQLVGGGIGVGDGGRVGGGGVGVGGRVDGGGG